MSKPKFTLLFLFCLIAINLIVGCGKANLRTESITQTPQIPAAQTLTLETSPTPSPTRAATSTKTITPASTVRPTSRPTLSPEDAHQLLLVLFENNGGCRFPCWFGFIPGQSSFSETKGVVETFSTMTDYKNTSTYREYLFDFRDLPSNGTEGRYGGILHGENPDQLTYVGFSAPITSYPLNKILIQYGPPDEIRIRSEGYYMGLSEHGTFWIVMYYKEQGIMVEYEGNMEKSRILDICFTFDKLRPGVRILLWDKEKRYSFIEAGEFLHLYTRDFNIDTDYRPINELSDLDVQSFYERYRLAENRGKCFSVPDLDWPAEP